MVLSSILQSGEHKGERERERHHTQLGFLSVTTRYFVIFYKFLSILIFLHANTSTSHAWSGLDCLWSSSRLMDGSFPRVEWRVFLRNPPLLPGGGGGGRRALLSVALWFHCQRLMKRWWLLDRWSPEREPPSLQGKKSPPSKSDNRAEMWDFDISTTCLVQAGHCFACVHKTRVHEEIYKGREQGKHRLLKWLFCWHCQ